MKTCSIKGLGQYFISRDGEDLTEKLVQAITRTTPDYTVLQSIKLYDRQNRQIPSNLDNKVSPLSNGEIVSLVDLLQPGDNAVKFEVEILDQNSN